MKKCFFKFWDKLRNTWSWLFCDDFLYFGEIELLYGNHDLALPLEVYGVCPSEVKEVWLSTDDKASHLPVCCGEDPRNWFNVQVCCDEIRIHAEVNTDKVLLKWFILT